jgi:tetratricopeptide (TPR) repeat protein
MAPMFISRRYRWIGLIVLVFGFAPVSRAAEQEAVPSSPSSLMQTPGLSDRPAIPSKAGEIRALWEANKKNEAERMLQDWIKKEQKSPDPLVTSASLRYAEGRYKKTLMLTEKALVKFPQSAEAYYWRGRAFEAQNKLLEAVNEYRAALLINKDYSDAQAGLNRVLLKTDPSPATISVSSGTESSSKETRP